MKLDGEWDRLRAWQYAERYLGVGTRDYSSFSADMDIAQRYDPRLGAASFVVPSFHIRPDAGAFLRNGSKSEVADYYAGEEGFLLPVHPEALADPRLPGRDTLLFGPRGPDLRVVPSANARTVFVERIGAEPVVPHFVKLHYPKRLSRFTRRLRRPIISLQLWTAEQLWAIDAPVLSEVAGGVLGEDPREAWGFLVREAEPCGQVPDELDYVVPLFALYGRDFHSPGDPTLMEQLVLRSGEKAGAWLRERVVTPMVRLWLDAAMRTGCVLEPHGQNTLLACDGDGRRSAVLYRDCAVYVDAPIRYAHGFSDPLPPVNVLSRDLTKPREQVLSLTYDSFMGHHTFDRLAQVAAETFGLAPEVLRRAARETFVEHGGGAVGLPNSVFYYDDQLHADGGWNLVDTGKPPAWRPMSGGQLV